jgi:small subunit ribosomal protein S8
MLTDPVADMLTRIRNAAGARKASVDMPWSKHKEAIARLLVAEGYLSDSALVDEKPHPVLRVGLRYDASRQPVITGIRRISKPSLRVYVGSEEIPSVRKGLGVSVISTPKGILSDREARKQGVGGEVICKIW